MDFKIKFGIFLFLAFLAAAAIIGGGALAQIASYSHIAVTP